MYDTILFDLDGTLTDSGLGITKAAQYALGQMGYEVPTYCHAPLLCSPDGRRLSKRDRDLDMGVLRQRYTPEELVGYLACTAGIIDRPEPVKAWDLVKEFSWDKVGTQDREPIIQL